VTSPATSVHGIRFYSAPQYGQNISTDVYLTLDRVDPDPERPRLIPSRLRDVPHFIFARAEGADFITFHLSFPHLLCSRDFNRLTDEQLSRWFDNIFYPAVRQVYDVDRLQHLPASYRHALATCRAPHVEGRLLETPSYQAQLRMSYFLPPQGLQQMWDHVLAAVCQPDCDNACSSAAISRSLCVARRLELLESDPKLMWLSVSFSWSYAELMPQVPTVCWQLVRHCPRAARRKSLIVD
jgi:hypothetical protein